MKNPDVVNLFSDNMFVWDWAAAEMVNASKTEEVDARYLLKNIVL